jgi:hypothetical protein
MTPWDTSSSYGSISRAFTRPLRFGSALVMGRPVLHVPGVTVLRRSRAALVRRRFRQDLAENLSQPATTLASGVVVGRLG